MRNILCFLGLHKWIYPCDTFRFCWHCDFAQFLGKAWKYPNHVITGQPDTVIDKWKEAPESWTQGWGDFNPHHPRVI